MEVHYTIKEASETLKIAESTIRRYLREGRLKGQKIGRVWRLSETAIAEFLETNGGLAANKEEAKGEGGEG